MGTPSSVFGILGRLLEVNHLTIGHTCLGAFLPRDIYTFFDWLSLAHWDSLRNASGRLLFANAVHSFKLVVPDFSFRAVTVAGQRYRMVFVY